VPTLKLLSGDAYENMFLCPCHLSRFEDPLDPDTDDEATAESIPANSVFGELS